MAPGVVTTVTIASGLRHRHAGFFLALGHGIIEFPLMFLIVGGVGRFLEMESVRIGIGLAGGVVLLWMGWAGLRGGSGIGGQKAKELGRKEAVWTGMVISITNPYFLLWWATIGLALAGQAWKLGMAAFLIFTVVHWLCDLVWLEILSYAAFKGSKLTSPRAQSVILRICAAAMAGFGIWFLIDAARAWLG